MNFEIGSSDLETREKITVMTFQSLMGPGCSVTEIYTMENEISTVGNRTIFSILQRFLLPMVIFRKFFHIS